MHRLMREDGVDEEPPPTRCGATALAAEAAMAGWVVVAMAVTVAVPGEVGCGWWSCGCCLGG